MNIGIDARAVSHKICGVSRYALCSLKALSSIDKKNKYIIYTDDLKKIDSLGDNFIIRKTNCHRMNLFYDYKFYQFINNDKLDVFHCFHSWLPIFLPKKVKVITTIHDIFSVTDPDFFLKRKPFDKTLNRYFRIITKYTINRTNAIITVSEFCKKEIQKEFKTVKRIEVIYNSPGIVPSGIKNAKRIINERYLFYLGNFRSYKNVDVLIRGFTKFLSIYKNDEILLVIAGNDSDPWVKNLAKELGIYDRIRFILKPSDIDICNLYSNALAFVFPSRYEGFGIPPLEAMSFGVPVIISDAEALVETSGNAALIFDRNSPVQLADTINDILTRSDIRENLINNGFETVKLYNWEASAKKLISLYETI